MYNYCSPAFSKRLDQCDEAGWFWAIASGWVLASHRHLATGMGEGCSGSCQPWRAARSCVQVSLVA